MLAGRVALGALGISSAAWELSREYRFLMMTYCQVLM